MANNVFHNNDSIIHQNADGEDKGEECDAVQGVSVEMENSESQGQSHRNSKGHYPGLTHAEDKPYEERYRKDRDKHMK